jgi:hypothetical protein
MDAPTRKTLFAPSRCATFAAATTSAARLRDAGPVRTWELPDPRKSTAIAMYPSDASRFAYDDHWQESPPRW